MNRTDIPVHSRRARQKFRGAEDFVYKYRYRHYDVGYNIKVQEDDDWLDGQTDRQINLFFHNTWPRLLKSRYQSVLQLMCRILPLQLTT
jgi:hypothetical protein